MMGFDVGGELGSSSSWINSFGSSQGQCKIQAPEIMYEMMDQSSGKAIASSYQAEWQESYINNNSIANPMAAIAGDAIVWTTANSNTAADVVADRTNDSDTIIQWPDYIPRYP